LKATKICYFETEDWAFHQHRFDLARAARDAGFQFALISPAGKHVDLIEKEGFSFFPITMERTGTNPVRERLSVMDLIGIYLKVRPDIVHHMALKPVFYGSLAAEICRIPIAINSLTGLGYLFTQETQERSKLRKLITPTLSR